MVLVNAVLHEGTAGTFSASRWWRCFILLTSTSLHFTSIQRKSCPWSKEFDCLSLKLMTQTHERVIMKRLLLSRHTAKETHPCQSDQCWACPVCGIFKIKKLLRWLIQGSFKWGLPCSVSLDFHIKATVWDDLLFYYFWAYVCFLLRKLLLTGFHLKHILKRIRSNSVCMCAYMPVCVRACVCVFVRAYPEKPITFCYFLFPSFAFPILSVGHL